MGTNNPLYRHLKDHDYMLTARSYTCPKSKRTRVITELIALYNCKLCGFRTMYRTTMSNHKCKYIPLHPAKLDKNEDIPCLQPAQLSNNITPTDPQLEYKQRLKNNRMSNNPPLGYKPLLNNNQISTNPPPGFKSCLNNNHISKDQTPGYKPLLNNNLIATDQSPDYEPYSNNNQISKIPLPGHKRCLNNNQISTDHPPKQKRCLHSHKISKEQAPGYEPLLNNNQISKDPSLLYKPLLNNKLISKDVPPGYKRCQECNPIEEAYACQKCNYVTKRASSLKVHMHIHSRHTPYRCTECEYGGNNLKDLIKHYTDVKNLQCECGYATHVKQRMLSHMRTHTGEKPYICKYCTFCTGSPASLARHVTTKHRYEV